MLEFDRFLPSTGHHCGCTLIYTRSQIYAVVITRRHIIIHWGLPLTWHFTGRCVNKYTVFILQNIKVFPWHILIKLIVQVCWCYHLYVLEKYPVSYLLLGNVQDSLHTKQSYHNTQKVSCVFCR